MSQFNQQPLLTPSKRLQIAASALPFLALAGANPAFAQSAENTATITAPAGVTDSNLANNSATDSDAVFADLVATNDNANGVDGLAGNTNVLNVLNGDTINGVAATISDVTISLAPGETLPPELTFDTATGQVGVVAGTPAGTYTFDYEICEIGLANADDNCRTATVTVEVVRDDADLVTAKTLVSGDSTPAEGDTVSFQIVVTNDGPGSATNVSLTDQLPGGLTAAAGNGAVTGTGASTGGSYDASSGVWTVGTLANGETATLTLVGTVDAGQGGQTITNITTAAAGDQVDPSTVGDDLEEAVTVANEVDLVTVKSLASGDSTPSTGDTVSFEITVTNNGPARATNVTLSDNLPAGLTATTGNGAVSGTGTSTGGSYAPATGLWTIGTLESGETATLTLVGTVNADQNGATITNITTAASGDQVDNITAGDDLDESVTVRGVADLVTLKTLASSDAEPGVNDTVTFLITVRNDGPDTATNITLTDQLPAGLTATGNNGVVSVGTYVAATGVWTIPSLANNATATLTLEGTVNAGQEGVNIENVTTAATTPDQDDPGTGGDDLTEAVDVVNTIVANDDDFSGTPVPSTGGNTATVFTDDTLNNAPFANNEVIASITNDGGLTGISINADGTLTVPSGTAPGAYTITYQICETADPDNCDTAQVEVVVGSVVDLSIVKSNGVDTVTSGDTITYTLVVSNAGPDTATGAVLRDTPGAGLTCPVGNPVAFTGSGIPAGSFTVGDLTGPGITLGSIGNGQSITVTYDCTVD